MCRAHAAELGNPVPEKPLLFLKPTSSFLEEGGAIVVSLPSCVCVCALLSVVFHEGAS